MKFQNSPRHLVLQFAPILLCLALSMPVSAAPATGNGTAATNTALTTVSSYKLGPGDVFRVTVANFPDYSQDSVPVPPDGKVNLPVFGDKIQVSGRTAGQIEAELRARLAKRMRNPQVTVTTTSFRPSTIGSVVVIGPVKAPGQVEIRPGYRVTEVLAAAGGVEARLDEVQSTLTRSGAAPIPLDLHQAISYPSSKANYRVQPGDVITISTVDPGHVAVLGTVVHPGVFDLRRAPRSGNNEMGLRPRLVDAIVTAGGLQAPAGNTATNPEFRAFLVRGAQKIELRLMDAIAHKDDAANLELQNGDFLNVEYVPPVPPLTVYVDGLVKTPGSFQVAPGTGVVEAIAQAGGIGQPVDKVVTNVRRNGALIPVDLQKAIFSNDAAADVKLLDKDLIVITESPTIKVQMVGQVARPELQKLAPGARLLDALASAGGLTIGPETARINILRELPDGRQLSLPIDPMGLIANRDLSQNSRLKDGDLVVVSAIQKKVVYVTGEVYHPGSYEIKDGAGVPDAIALAAGQTDKALLSRVTVTRNGKAHEVDAYGALKQGKALNFPLEDGDLVVVPTNTQQVTVLGAALRPGNIPIDENESLTVSKAIAKAGGTRPMARTQEVALIRQAPDGQIQTQVISLTKPSGPGVGMNTPVHNGDIIDVPEGQVTASGLTKVVQIGSLLGLLRAITR